MFLSEDENMTNFNESLIWCLDDITFGSWNDGPNNDGIRVTAIELDVPEVNYNQSL